MIQEFFQPRSLGEALELKQQWGADARPVVGGTDLLVKIRDGIVAPKAILDLSRVPELRRFERREDAFVFGAAVTAERCIRDAWIHEHFPALWRASQWLGGPQMQHVGTLGGNLANASPAADTVPALMVAGAVVKLTSLRGSRTLAIEDFLVGPGRTRIEPDELIEEISVPMTSFNPANPRKLLTAADEFRLNVTPRHAPLDATSDQEYTINMFYKAGARLAQVISIACVAGWARMKGNTVVDIRLAYGSAAPTTKRGHRTEEMVRGKQLTPTLIESACEAVAQDISPIDDVRGSGDYKLMLCTNYTRLFLRDLIGLEPAGVDAPVDAPSEVTTS
ncbi:FAD binding domain-containing protein [bacterium]|nr:FAD binding domain-containing protein [bacterium]